MTKFLIIITFIITGLFGLPQWQEAREKQQILAATVSITMIVPQWTEDERQEVQPLPVPPEEVRPIASVKDYLVAEGLGTMVQANDRFYLITHDHWSQLAANLGAVQFRDASGTLLAEMDLYSFKRLILSRNGGTMVLSAPDPLHQLAVIAENPQVTGSDDLWLVHRQEGRLEASRVQKVAADVKDGLAVWRLQGPAVTGGDSGGGVWAHGRLAAVTWTAVVMENQTNSELRTTDLSTAAVLEDMPQNLINFQSLHEQGSLTSPQ